MPKCHKKRNVIQKPFPHKTLEADTNLQQQKSSNVFTLNCTCCRNPDFSRPLVVAKQHGRCSRGSPQQLTDGFDSKHRVSWMHSCHGWHKDTQLAYNWKCQWLTKCQICSLNIIFHWRKIGFVSRKLFFSQMICFAWQSQESKQSWQSSPDNFMIFASGFFPFFFFGSVSGQMSRAVMLLGRNQSKSKWYWWAHTTHASRSVSYLEPCVSYRVFDIIFFLSPWVCLKDTVQTPRQMPHICQSYLESKPE